MQTKLGLKEYWQQFTLPVIINGFLGGMVDLKQIILLEIAATEFSMRAKTIIPSKIVVYGISEVITNYYTSP